MLIRYGGPFDSSINIMRYRLRTLLVLLAIGPPIIGYWPALKRHAIHRATQISASDVVVVAALSTLLAMRWRIDRDAAHRSSSASDRTNDHEHTSPKRKQGYSSDA